MGELHTFGIESIWTGGSDGDGVLKSRGLGADYTRPGELGGPGRGTNPEELLLAAVVSCYSITLAGMAEGRRMPVTRLEVRAEGDVVRDANRRLKFAAIRLYPRIHVSSTDATVLAKVEDAAHKAEQYCLISDAMRGAVEITVEPRLVTTAPEALVG